MQYLVKTSGNVSVKENETYVVTAKNQQEAVTAAKNMFITQHNVVDYDIVTTPGVRSIWSVLSIVLLLISSLLSCIRWVNGHNSFDIKPDLKTGILAILFYVAYLWRIKGIGNIANSKLTDVVSVFPTVFTIASIFKIVLSEKTISFPFINITIDSTMLMIISFLLSYFGISKVSLVTMGLTCLMALFSINALTKAMGLMGFIYVFSAAFGLLVKTAMDPSFYAIFPSAFRIISKGVRTDLENVQQEISNKRKKSN